MSVTFSIQSDREVESYVVSCDCVESSSVVFDSLKKAEQFVYRWSKNPVPFQGCTDSVCLEYAPIVTFIDGTEDAPTVNVSNMNASDILEVLGYEDEDLSGSDSGESFLGRILMAVAVAPISAERITETHESEHFGVVTMCGRVEGYVQNVLNELRSVADAAVKNNMVVVWG